MKKRIKKLLFLGIFTTGTIYAINCFLNYTAGLKNLLTEDHGHYFDWKNGDIYYSVHGSGSPVLLVHDLHPFSSGYEWTRFVRKLEKEHTVYVIDLLGCGRSDKPNIIYTSYLYVELLHEFISQVIKEKTVVIATGASVSFSIMENHMHKDDIEKLIIVNPQAISESEKIPDDKSRLLKSLISLPIFGTFIYNIESSTKNIGLLFREMYYSNPSLVNEKITDTYFESAHKGFGAGRYLLASLRGHYMNSNVKMALKGCDNLYFVGSRDRSHSVNIIDEYANYNYKIESAYVSHSKYLPQLEVPDKLCETLKLFL